MRFGIRLKLVAYTVLVMSMVGLAIAAYTIHTQKLNMYRGLITSAKAQVNLLDKQLVDSVYDLKLNNINQILDYAKRNTEVVATYVLGRQGKLLADGVNGNIYFDQKITGLDDYIHALEQSQQTQVLQTKGMIYVGKVIKTYDQKPIGIVILKFSSQHVQALISSEILQTIVIIIGLLIVGISIATFITGFYLRAFVRMSKDMEIIAQGDQQHLLTVYSKDERGELARSINKMVSSLRDVLKAANLFVPNSFLKLLGKEDIAHVQLGDHIQKNMTVLFADIRDFTAMSEQMTPSENFEFVNEYLGYITPPIIKNNGYIDKYIGDAVMAIFPKADEALRAANQMLVTLRAYNHLRKQRHDKPIKIGIGINTGSLMLGTVGSEYRIEGTVIADAVNTAARVEALNKKYKTSILITLDTYTQLEVPDRYLTRVIDRVIVKGKEMSVMIYEVFDQDVAPLREYKKKHVKEFNHAVIAFMHRDYQEATQVFHQLKDPKLTDPVLDIYLAESAHHN